MIKLIIVDFYGVMIRGSYQDTCRWLAKIYGGKYKDIYEIVYHKYFNQAALGKISENYFLQAAMTELNYPISGKRLLKIHLSFQRINKAVFKLCLNLQKKGYKILLLSKNTPQQFHDVLNKFKIKKKFKNVVNTYNLGLPKDSPKVIEYIMKKYDLKAGEILMIDDQDFNLVSAKKMGVNVLLYKSDKALNRNLSLIGIKL